MAAAVTAVVAEDERAEATAMVAAARVAAAARVVAAGI
jgi:hypothetical protein